MTLYDLVWNFFYHYIFWDENSDTPIYLSDMNVNIFDTDMSLPVYISHIASLITMIIILIVIGHFIKKVFNLFGRII